MPSIINATTTNGVAISPDNSGSLQLQTNNGTTAVTISTGQQVQVNTAGSASAPVISKSDDTNTGIFFPAADTIAFSEGGVESMRITSSGDLLIGTTTSGAKVTVVNTNNATNALKLQSTASGDVGQQQLFIAKFDNNSTTSQVFVRFSINNDATASGQINANGASAVAFGTWSDIRLKENIEDLPTQLENICSLRPVEFDYKTGGHQIGFIAQEMQAIYPDVVGEDSEGMLTVTGWSKTEARLVKAIQELKSELDTVKAELQALKGTE